MTDTATLQARLDEARAALHKLLTGKQVFVVGYDGKTVTYSPRQQADVAALQLYIRSLEQQLGLKPRRVARRLYF